MDLHILRFTESKKVIFGMSSVSLCLCVHYNSKNNWTSSNKFGMWSYMMKFLAGIAYGRNWPTGLASALIAQFGFLAKSVLKIRCTKFFFQTKVVTNHNTQLWGKFFFFFFDRPMGLASAVVAQLGFLAKGALKMHCTTFFQTKVVTN